MSSGFKIIGGRQRLKNLCLREYVARQSHTVNLAACHMSQAKQTMRVGIIGGGLMGREAAGAFGRWFVLENIPVRAELVAVCDVQEKLLEWFRQVPSVKLFTKDHLELLRSPEVDVVYEIGRAHV